MKPLNYNKLNIYRKLDIDLQNLNKESNISILLVILTAFSVNNFQLFQK